MTQKLARAPSADQPHAWHIDKADGTGETVVAHICNITPTGIVSFHNRLPNGDAILVRALRLSERDNVVLVDTPFGPSIQLDHSTGKRS